MCEMDGVPFIPVAQRPKLKRVMRSLKRIYRYKTNRKEPVTLEMLRKMKKVIDAMPDTLATRTLWAQVLTAFYTFIRSANYTSSTKFSFDPETDLTVGKLIKRKKRWALKLTKTKTVQFGERDVIIWIPKIGGELCPTKAIDRMIDQRESWQPHEPLFADGDGIPVTKRKFNKDFKMLLSKANLGGSDVSPHSLRRGGATYALECNVPPVCIKMQGDWVSDAWMLYAIVTDKLKLKTVKAFEWFGRT